MKSEDWKRLRLRLRARGWRLEEGLRVKYEEGAG